MRLPKFKVRTSLRSVYPSSRTGWNLDPLCRGYAFSEFSSSSWNWMPHRFCCSYPTSTSKIPWNPVLGFLWGNCEGRGPVRSSVWYNELHMSVRVTDRAESQPTSPISVGPISSSFSCCRQLWEESCLVLQARPVAGNNDLADIYQFCDGGVSCRRDK